MGIDIPVPIYSSNSEESPHFSPVGGNNIITSDPLEQESANYEVVENFVDNYPSMNDSSTIYMIPPTGFGPPSDEPTIFLRPSILSDPTSTNEITYEVELGPTALQSYEYPRRPHYKKGYRGYPYRRNPYRRNRYKHKRVKKRKDRYGLHGKSPKRSNMYHYPYRQHLKMYRR